MAFTTINKSSLHFSPTLYVGNGGTKTVTGIPFEPDMTWLKNRSVAGDNEIYDKLRGATYRIYPNNNSGQDALAQGLQAWTSDGFTVGNNNAINGNGNNQVSWNWKMNGTGSSNTAGSINTTATSANTTSGCAMITYTGTGANATIGHGLGVAPQVVIYKRTNTTGNWFMYNKNIGNTKYLNLDANSAVQTYNVFQNTDPSSTLLYVSGDSGANASGGTYVAYCFAEKQGFSKFGSYTGNGNADGKFVYTGFKPAYVIAKRTDNTGNWNQFDNKRFGFNVKNPLLYPNLSNAESDNVYIDLLSNGFKWRTTNGDINASGGSYIYMAFAEAPLVGTNNVPATAR
jgi:hypothetical protein